MDSLKKQPTDGRGSIWDNVKKDGKYDWDIGNGHTIGAGVIPKPGSGFGISGNFKIPNGNIKVGLPVLNNNFRFNPGFNVGASWSFGK